MSAGTDGSDIAPRTSVRRAYERCLATRQQWRAIRAKTVDESIRDEAHGDLHEAVMAWFETLVPYISQRPGETKQLWESAPLYPQREKLVPGLACSVDRCPFAVEKEEADLAAGQPCPACGHGLQDSDVVQTTDDGDPLYEWACGLKRLASWSSATETVVVESSDWDTGENAVEVPKRLDPDVLLRAARYLDLAAEECGLLEETDRALPTGEL